MAFKIQDDVAIAGVDKTTFVFVKFVATATPKFTFYQDAAATTPYASHDFDAPPATTGALYFWLTADSDADARFAEQPCAWGSPAPSSVSDAHMAVNGKAFSLKVNNWSPHSGDDSYSFQLIVEDGQGNPHTSQESFEVDPTIIEKGDPGGSF